LPLDPEYPVERLRFMLADSDVKVLVGHRGVAGDLAADALVHRTVWLDDPAVTAEAAAMPVTSPPVTVHGAQSACVIYTSGSTGTPKGVVVHHAGLVSLVAAQTEALGTGADDVILQFASFSFDASVWELVMALASGGTLVVATPAQRAEPALLAGLATRAAVTVATVPPSLLDVLDPGDDLRGVGTLIAAGERLEAGLATKWSSGRRLVNAYGPTENTVCATVALVTGGGGVPPIGAPIANTRVYVLDDRMNPVPVGVAGEVFIGGAQQARGYLDRPALTAGRFVASPFACDGSRLYRSGDRARWRADGRLEFLGRVDDQVKVRGHRIEPGEIETVLAAHPGVRSAVVTATGEGTERRLVAHLVPADLGEGIPEPGNLRAHLRRSVPDFMVPSVFTELAAFPLNPSGKVDRAALPAPDGASTARATDTYVAPRTEVERVLAEVWTQVLDVDRVGAEDGFIELGGHSLLATQVISRVRTVFGVELPLATLFDRPTVRGLAAAVEEATQSVAAPPVTAAGRDQPLPLSFSQQRLWFLDQLEPGSVEYIVPTPVRWAGDLDVAALGMALGAVVARHEVLRTRLVAGPDGVGYQVIDPPAPFPLPVADVSAGPEPFRAAERLVRADAVTPFDLAAGPLVRALLIRIGPAEHALALTMHHVVADEWSGQILRRELSALYEAFRDGRPDPLPPLTVQYADFAMWQRRWLSGQALEGQLAYWTDRLADCPALELPTDRPRPRIRTSAGAMTEFTVSPRTVERLRAVARENGASMFMTLQAAFSALLARYSGQDDFAVGTPVAGRNRAETEDLMGFFVNTLVLRTDLSGDPTFTELLGRVRETALSAYTHQDLPFEQLVDALATERDRSRSPLFQVLLNYFTDEGQGVRQDADEDAVPIALREVVAAVDLRLILTDTGQGLSGTFEYSTDLFDTATAERMARHLVALLESVAADAGQAVWDVPLLSPAEGAMLLDDWNRTPTPSPGAAGVHELIADKAVLYPDSVAVVCEGASLTYARLIDSAARLAHQLRGMGVGPETVVGLCLPRGADMMVAMLAVWQAGGAYLPLDPEHPVDRLDFMLADSRVAVVLGTTDLVDELPVGRRRTLCLDEPLVRTTLAAMPSTPPEVAIAGEQLAYVIYTSGSTGRPKGVQVTHGGVVNLVAGQAPVFAIGRGDTVVQFASFAFDASVSEVCVTLAGGGTLVVATAQERLEPGALAGLLR
ncbi:amino acid adenylation domain-containing protein, partial [Streptomyces sp. NPDC048484]|uniref:amino acid adenylation domain-containing protein n=1 Tax=Streptomyces sp. NPDC048484 TaxID=3155146 RepID=UPI0034198955